MPAQRMNWEEIMTPPSPEEVARDGPPGGIGFVTHADLSAEMAEGDRSSAEVLATHALTDEAWLKATIYWMGRVAQDAQENGLGATLAVTYSEAFTQRQD